MTDANDPHDTQDTADFTGNSALKHQSLPSSGGLVSFIAIDNVHR